MLIGEIQAIHAASYGIYDARTMWHAMHRAGWDLGRDQTARLMRRAGVAGAVRGRRPRTTLRTAVTDHRPDLVKRNFKAPGPGRLWVADITYIRMIAGFVYTAFATDVFSRRIVS